MKQEYSISCGVKVAPAGVKVPEGYVMAPESDTITKDFKVYKYKDDDWRDAELVSNRVGTKVGDSLRLWCRPIQVVSSTQLV